MKDKVYDYIIIGQGLAGSALATQLLHKKKSILLIDNQSLHSSSGAAAGIFNPITGRRWATTWRAQEIFSYFPDFYKEMEKITGIKFLFEKPIYRSFQNRQEQNDWISKPKSELPPFVKEIKASGQFQEYISDPHGGLLLAKSGYLDVRTYLAAMREYFKSHEILDEGAVDIESVKWESPFLVNGYRGNRLILCMGFEGTRNTPFGEKPFRVVKGELLIANSDRINPDIIFNGPVFILPNNEKTMKVGATYEFHDRSEGPTEKARKILWDKLTSYHKGRSKIESQIAGFRPSSVDRRPVAGEHPEIANLGILNGLGTKGVSLAPYIAKLLIEKFENGKELDREIDIKRFFK